MAKLTMKEREYLRIADEMLAKDRKAQTGGGASSLTPAARTALETHVQVYPRQGSVEARQLAGNSLAYAQQSPKNAQEVALGLAAGNATRPSKGNISALDMNQLRQGTLDNETAMKILRDLGALNTIDNARNRETISMVGTDYLKEQATTSKALMAANSAMDGIYSVGKRLAYPDVAAKKEKAAQWRDFYSLYGYEKEVPLEIMLRAEAIANGTGRTVRDFDLMDDETYDREYAALEEWYKGLDHFALTEDPKEIAYESETGKWAEMADMQSAELSRRETIERLTAMAMGNADYETLSQYTAPAYMPVQPKYNDANSRAYAQQQNKFVGQLVDQQYYINNPGTYSQRMRAADVSPVVREYMNAGYEYLTPDEIGVYNALYSMDQAAAAEYLEALSPDLLRRRAQVQYNYNTVIGEDPFAGAAASLATILRSPAAALNTLYGGITGEDDPNASIYDLQRGDTAIRTAQAQLWGDMASFDVLGQPVGTTIYNTLMSLGDMGMAYLTGGALAGGNAAFAQQAMGFIMSSDAAAGTLHEDLQRGFTAEQALLHGIANGAVEYLSEQIPLGELFSNEGKLAWRILKTGLSEGGEEIFSGTVQIGTDALFSYMSGRESEVETVYKEYAKTMSHEDAVRATLSHYAEEVALQGVTGFLSGGAMGTAAHTANDMQVRSYGKSVMAEGDVDALMNIAGDMRSDSQSAEWARTLTEKKNKGMKISTYDVGRLTMAMESDLSAELAKAPNMVMDKAVEERLVELGEDSANAAKLAPVIRKLYRGQKISPAARMSVNWSDNASQVVRELTTEVREGDEGRVGRDWKVRAVQLAEETSAPYVDKGVLFEKALHTKPGTTTETTAAPAVSSDTVVQQGEEMAAAGKNKFGPNPLTRAVIFDADGAEQTGEVARFEKDKDGMHAVVATTTDGKTANVTVDLESITASASAGIGSVIRYVQNASTRGHDMSAAEASSMIRLYEQEGGDAKTFIDGFEKAYLAGYAGIELDSAGISEKVAKIAYDQGKAEAVADERGRVARATRVRSDSKGVVSWLGKVSSGKEVRGTGDPNALSAAMRKMTSSQRTTVQVVQAFADKFKTNVVLFESSEENIGGIENGSYDPNTNTIYIDINSGADSAESIKAGRKHNTLGHAMVRTLGHELTHHLESTSPEAYATYKQAVKTALKEQGQDWATLVRGKLDTARNAGRKLTYAGAEAEVIADASEYMLQNSKFVKEIDNSTKGRVKKFIKDFMKKLGEVFSTLTRAHAESAAIRKEVDGVKQYMGNLQQLWDAAMEESMGMETSMEAEAVEFSDVNAQFSIREEAPPKKNGEYQSNAMITAAGLQNPDGSRMFSLRSFTDDYDTYRDMLARHNMDEAEIQALFDTIDVVMKAIETDREILDFGWNVGREDRSFNPVKQNSDPLYKVSIDFSTLCRKRLLQQAVQERLESMYDTVLTKAERVAIRNELMKLREEGKQIEVACALCYVESTRLKSPAQIQRFFDDRRAVLVDYFAKKNKEYAKLVNAKAGELIVKFGHEPGTKKKELNTFQKNAVTNLKQNMNKDYKPSAEEEAIIATAMSLPGESFKTDKGLWDLKREHEEIFDAYTSFVRNATKSKGIEGDEAWWAGDSESISDSLIESMNAENGLRTQSWSDFQVIHLLDYMAAIIELSTRNAKMQSYTKVPDFVNLMGDTGVMINLSLIPKGFDGTLNYDPIEGMPIEEALALRDSFPETAGTICIGITKKHIEMLLANPDIDYVIPYHSSSLDKKTRQQMGMKVWEDFQAYQNEKNKDYPNTDSKSDKYHKKPLFSEWFDHKTVSSRANELAAEAIAKLKNPTESQKVDAKRRAAEQAMKEAAYRYKELCHQRGLQEKFEQFSGEPNYWKLLIDRKMISQKTGEIIEQKAVKPRFDKDRILSILSAEVNRFKEQNADKDAAVKHIVEAWENGEIRKAARSKKVRDQVSAFNDTVTVANIVASAEELGNPDIRYSTRDAEYMQAVESGDMETAQRMVDEAAKEAGYTVKAYHGTPTGGFTVFDRSYIGLNTGVGRGRFSFTSDKGTANAYAKANKGSNASTLVAELNKLFKKHASAEISELFIGDPDAEVVEFDPDIVIAEGALDHGYIDFDYDWRDETPDKYSSESEAKEAEAAATFDGTRLYLLDDLKRMQRGAPDNTKAFFEEAIRTLETVSMNATPQTYSVYIKRPGATYSADASTYNSTAWDAAYDQNDVTEVKLDNGESRYFVTSPESIKSADPVTYDDSGNVIPLSERFNTESPDIRYSTRDLPPEVTAREFLAEADSSIAETVEERNALSIYQGLLLKHADASDKVIAAERVLAVADEEDLPEARKALTVARARQKELYNRLLNVERTAHVQTIVKRTNRIIGELSGKNQVDVDNMVSALERKVESLRLDLQGLKVAAKTQREADARASERDIVAHEIKAAKEQREADLRAAKRELAVYKSKAAQALIANNEKHTKRIADLRERNELNVEIGKKARHIKRVVKRLNDRIIHEEDYKNVKEPLKPAVHNLVRAFIDGFGNLVFDQKTASKLKAVYDVLAQDDATVEYYDDEVSDWLTTLADLSRQDEERRASGSTLENLNDKLYTYTTLADIADHVAHMVTAADTIFMEGKDASVSGLVEDIGDALLAKEDRRELAGALGKAANFADNLIIRGNMMPQFFFEGLNNKGMMRLYDGLQNGVQAYSERLLNGQTFLENAMRRHGYHAWGDMNKTVEFKTKQGHIIHLKRENMMWIYATAKREASNPLMDTHHLDEGGFVYEESSVPTKGLFKAKGHQQQHKIVQEDVKAITEMLTEEQIAFMDECVEFLSTECAEWGNEASMQLFGIKKYKESYYFPFKVDSNQLYKNSAAGSTSTTSDARVKHISFSYSIKKGANTPLVMGEFTSTIADHINQMATYSGLVVPIENMNRVLNRKVDDGGDMVTIRSLFSRKHGSPSSKYVDDLLKDLNGGPQTDNRGAWDAGIRLFKKNAVVGKLSVAVQQPTAITRAFAYINPRWFANLRLERPKVTWERMMKYSGTAVLKDVGGFNVGLGQGAKNWVERGDLGDYNVFKRAKFLLDQKGLAAAKDEWVDFLTGLPGWMDKVTWIFIWNAVENEQAHRNPGMDRNSDEFLQIVGRRFDDIVNHTQVYDSILSKSQNMRSKNALAKMATSFMAESTLNMNLAYRAFASKDVKQIGRVISSLLLNAALGAAAYALVGAFNKDDDDRTLEERYAVAFAGRLADNLNPLASIPYLSDIWNKIQGYDVERTDLSYVLDLAEDGMKFFDKMFNPDEALSYRDYENFVGGMFAAVTGIPAKNWMGDARRVWNMMHVKTENAPSSRVWYGILDEMLPWRETNNTSYYDRYLAALKDGDKQEQYDLKDYMLSTKGVSEGTFVSEVRNAYKKEFLRGGISKEDGVAFLLAHGLASGETAEKKKQSAFQYVDKWVEGTDGYSVYNTLENAFAGGNSSQIQSAWSELENNGYTEKQLQTQTRTILKELVKSGKISPAQATELLRRYSPYKDDKNNVKYPQDWLNEKE